MLLEDLQELEESMSQREILERAKTLRPIGTLKDDNKHFWLKADRIATIAFLWEKEALQPVEIQSLRELGRVTTFHTYGHPSLFKPTVSECIYQCPYPEATAFMIVGTPYLSHTLHRHAVLTVYFAGEIPAEVKDRELEW